MRLSAFLRDLTPTGPWEPGTFPAPATGRRWACTTCEVTWNGDDASTCWCCEGTGVRWVSPAPDGWPKLALPDDWSPEELV